MMYLKADAEGLQKLRQWTISGAFLAACLWVTADAVTRVSEAQPAESKATVEPRPTSAAEWMAWGIREALEGDDDET